MAAPKTHRHLHIQGIGVASKEFRAIGMGSEKDVLPVKDRKAHAAALVGGLEQAVADIDDFMEAQRAAGVPSSKRGMPITIESRPEVPLSVGTARSGRGFALLNVKRRWPDEGEEGGSIDQAIYYAVPKTVERLRSELDDYKNWKGENEFSDEDILSNVFEDDEDTSRPLHLKLFESAGQIRPTTLQDLWTDRQVSCPTLREDFEWEVWTRSGFQNSFDRAIKRFELQTIGEPTVFVDTVVRGIKARPDQIFKIVQASAAVVGLRSASSFAVDDLEIQTASASSQVSRLVSRVRWPKANAPVVTLLDTGVRRSHPLLGGALPTPRMFAVETYWDTKDHSGHGTKMAGVVLYGDIADLPKDESPIDVVSRLESVVVNPPKGLPKFPAKDAIPRAVEAVETVKAVRVYCLAQTAAEEAHDGLPTATSGALDQTIFNDGIKTRLFFAAAGNVPHSKKRPYQLSYYANRNADFGIQSPAQAVNTITVGAVSLKDIKSKNLKAVAPAGDLSPTSRTAQSWAKLYAHKPDIVMEGGNFVLEDDGFYCAPSTAHMVLTTSAGMPSTAFEPVGETSAATAACAGLASRLLAQYPKLRMETVRALMVNAAEWTPEMLALHPSNRDAPKLIARFGWGIPNEKRLFQSAGNALTLMVEDTIVPYCRSKKNSTLNLKEMKYFELPWPKEALRALGGKQVEMYCTLSYFIEPDAHAPARDRMDRYASHRLKFEVKRYGENHEQSKARFNALSTVSDADEGSVDDGWLLGPRYRHKGTLHHDIWKGPAFELLDRGGISILPVKGWWGDSASFKRYEHPVHFTLVVTIRTPETDGIDLVVEAAAAVNPANWVETPVAVVRT
ncbi:S8 family peptidase [Methylobacterium sp. E-041]|uniref:S8 family peptidase n=1 Tax=Methylobacterium sp. E-041 TaxID=2836573 RepID=UPI001FBA2E78|nr:S8 family peptidase [Methylobacterium sp. E-041]MCJ2105528.1 S8 family peptidase [Methylobacterium sp. E-041]